MAVEKVALITAGGSGMGADAARKLAEDGFKIGILSSSDKVGHSCDAGAGRRGNHQHLDLCSIRTRPPFPNIWRFPGWAGRIHKALFGQIRSREHSHEQRPSRLHRQPA